MQYNRATFTAFRASLDSTRRSATVIKLPLGKNQGFEVFWTWKGWLSGSFMTKEKFVLFHRSKVNWMDKQVPGQIIYISKTA